MANTMVGGRRKHTFDGTVEVSEDVWESMQAHAAERPDTEVGGMLFGAFERGDGGVVTELRVERVVNVPREHGVNEPTFFSIEPDFMSSVIDEYTPQYTYLGNWHSHLGYGGPSGGDYEQVTEFFENNPSRDLLVAIIQDRKGSPHSTSYTQHIELYERADERTTDYEIFKIEELQLIEHPEERETPRGNRVTSVADQLVKTASELDVEDGLRSDVLNLIDELETRELLDQSGNGTIYQKTGAVDEVVALVPVRLHRERTDDDTDRPLGTLAKARYVGRRVSQMGDTTINGTEERDPSNEKERETDNDTVPALIGISVPQTYPDGDIYIDIKSRDQTVQATVDTLPCSLLRDRYDRVAMRLDAMLEQEIMTTLRTEFGELLADADSNGDDS